MRTLGSVFGVVLALSAGSVQAQAALTLSDQGLAGLGRDTPFEQAAIQKALPGLAIEKSETRDEGVSYPIFRALDNGKEVLTITSDPEKSVVGSFMTTSPLIVSDKGIKVGSRFAEIFSGKLPDECEPGLDEWVGMVFCPAPGSTSVQLFFKGNWKGPEGSLPPLNVLNDWTVAQIWWLAPE